MSTVKATRGSINRHVRAVAAVTALGGLHFGYDTGVVSGALLFLKTQFGGLSSFQGELVISFLLVGAMVGALAAGRVADRIGQRPLLLFTGTAGMALGMVITGLAFLGGNQLHGWTAYLGIAGLLIYAGSFAVGLGPVFWLMIAEIYPLRIRGQAMSVATVANWGANFLVSISFLTLLNALTPKGVFLLFAFLTLVALWYFAKRVPETRKRSLQQIEQDLNPRLDPVVAP